MSEERAGPADVRVRLTGAEWRVLLVLAAVQLTHIMDFVIVMPLGPRFQKQLEVDAAQFGYMVAAYGFSAGLASLLAAWFIDRFDRKRALLALYGGLTAGTFLCAFAPDYLALLLARALAGAFGGVTAAAVLTIVGDLFPDSRRGMANGIIMSAFSVASILGLPAGLWLAAHSSFGWRAPFAVLAVVSAGVLLLAWMVLPPLRGHLQQASGPRINLWEVLSEPTHVRAYALSIALVLSSFLIVPYLTTYLDKNLGRPESELPLIYLFGGLATLLSTPLVGRLSDLWGKLPVFRVLALLAAIPMFGVTHLPTWSSLTLVLVVTTLMMILSSGRMVPALALITASAAPRRRGSFLSVNSSMQQMAMGLASVLGGAILGTDSSGALTGYGLAGVLASGVALVSVILAGQLRPAEGGLDAADHLEEDEEEPEHVGASLRLLREMKPETVRRES
jgi:predicted MFS family arabinose efflux permease